MFISTCHSFLIIYLYLKLCLSLSLSNDLPYLHQFISTCLPFVIIYLYLTLYLSLSLSNDLPYLHICFYLSFYLPPSINLVPPFDSVINQLAKLLFYSPLLFTPSYWSCVPRLIYYVYLFFFRSFFLIFSVSFLLFLSTVIFLFLSAFIFISSLSFFSPIPLLFFPSSFHISLLPLTVKLNTKTDPIQENSNPRACNHDGVPLCCFLSSLDSPGEHRPGSSPNRALSDAIYLLRLVTGPASILFTGDAPEALRRGSYPIHSLPRVDASGLQGTQPPARSLAFPW